MNAAVIALVLRSARLAGNGWRCRCLLADEHKRTGR
jgi:hypothetical protein